MSDQSKNTCASCGKPYPGALSTFGLTGLRLECRECCTETRRLIHWGQALLFLAIVTMVLVLGLPLPAVYQIPLWSLVILTAVLSQTSGRINRAWPGIRARSKVIPAFEVPDHPPPHTPVPPPTPLKVDKRED